MNIFMDLRRSAGQTTVTHRFQQVKLRRTVRIPCNECGRLGPKVLSAMQTINTWNKYPDGRLKTKKDILAELPAELDLEEKRARKLGRVCMKCAG